MRRLIGASILATLLVLGAGTPAFADTAGAVVTDGRGISHHAEADSSAPGSSGGSGRAVCEYRLLPIDDDFTVYDDETGRPIETDGTGSWYEKWCDGTFYGSIYVSRRDPQLLLDEARRYLELPTPEPQLSPPGDQIVNVASWLAVTDWSTQRSTVSVPGITVTVDAVPESVTWSMGDGTAAVVCTGPGSIYVPTEPVAEQQPTCTHTFARSSAREPSGAFIVTVTVRWLATWTVTGFPGGGPLGTIARSSTFPIRVAEVQAINTATNPGHQRS